MPTIYNSCALNSKHHFSYEDQIHLLLALKNFYSINAARKRYRHSYFKIVYAIYLFTKRCKLRGDDLVFPEIKTLMQISGCGRSVISEFINSKFFSHFGRVTHNRLPNGKNTSNTYVLYRWVGVWFRFLEKHGFMRGFKTDHKKWSQDFQKRMEMGLLRRSLDDASFNDFCSQLLNANYTEQKRLMNRLSTKTDLKPDAAETLKPDAIKPKGYSYKASKEGSIRTSKENPHSILPKLEKTERILVDEFQMGEIDVHFLMNNNRPSTLQRAINQFRTHTSSGWNPRSKIAYFTSLLSKKSKNTHYTRS